MRRPLALLVLLTVVVVGACSNSSDKQAAAPTTAVTTTTSSSSTTNDVGGPSTTAVAASPSVLTDRGIGKLRIDMTLAAAKATGEIGATRPGCELGGPGELVADINTGVADGLVYFNDELLSGIVVRGGAKTATGVGSGSTVAQIQQAYPPPYDVKVDHSTEEVFGAAIVSVSRSSKQLFGFDVDPSTNKARTVAIPAIRTCE
jgi:hypothetical protein